MGRGQDDSPLLGHTQGEEMLQVVNMTQALLSAKKKWCSCENGEKNNPDAWKWSVEMVRGEETMKHIVSYYVCLSCKGLIKVEES